MLKQGVNHNLVYIGHLYEIVDNILDTVQLWKDWDRQVRYRDEKIVRQKLNRLKNNTTKLIST